MIRSASAWALSGRCRSLRRQAAGCGSHGGASTGVTGAPRRSARRPGRMTSMPNDDADPGGLVAAAAYRPPVVRPTGRGPPYGRTRLRSSADRSWPGTLAGLRRSGAAACHGRCHTGSSSVPAGAAARNSRPLIAAMKKSLRPNWSRTDAGPARPIRFDGIERPHRTQIVDPILVDRPEGQEPIRPSAASPPR